MTKMKKKEEKGVKGEKGLTWTSQTSQIPEDLKPKWLKGATATERRHHY